MRNLWREVLRHVRPVFGLDAVIAGGAIRDEHLGLPFKDLDIFVNMGEYSYPTMCEKIEALNDLNCGFTLSMVDMSAARDRGDITATEYDDWNSSEGTLIGVAEGTYTVKDRYYPDLDVQYDVNIIARRDHSKGLDHLISRFDMGVVQAYFDGVAVHGTEAYITDTDNKTATLMREDTLELSIKRFERFDKRNPGVLTLVNPYSGRTSFEAV